MRLFFGAMLPEPIQQALGGLRRRLEWLPVRPTWTAAANIHITLKFLGEVADDQVTDIVELTKLAIQPEGPLTLRPADAVMFPPEGPARVLGVGFTGDVARLIALQEAIESACTELGFTREQRAYVPHATLARIRDGLRATHRPRVIESCATIQRLPSFQLTEVQLMQSILSREGSQYTPAAHFPI